MLTRKILFLLFVITIATGRLSAQVYAPAAADSFAAAYNPSGGTDEVFVFNRPTYKAEITASIVAVSVDKLSGWTFQWSVFNQGTKEYVNIPITGPGWFSEIDTISVSSGYRVIMTNGSEVDTFRVWLLINDLDLHITNKDADDKLSFGYYWCSSLDLMADTTQFPLFYYNPVTKARINVYNTYLIRWKTDNDEATTPSSRLITRVTSPPSEDTWYMLTLSDKFGLERSDSVYYESIQSKAKITGEYISLSDPLEYPGRGYGQYYADGIKSAPGKYRFDMSGSRNMASYEIDFGDGGIFASEGDTLEVVHEYIKPGEYKVVLTTKSEEPYECIDSVSVMADLEYAKADNFVMPNVFTPNNDEFNKWFRSEDVSVLFIDIAIFNRAGMKVHSYSGDIRDWEGWDGNIRNSNIKAPEGVYFYVISTFAAYEDKNNPISRKIMKGFVHLYR
jgi:gliding motility-associated-like protein